MNKHASTPFLITVKKLLFPSNAIIDDDTRKYGMLIGILLVGILFLSLLGSLALWQGVQLLAGIDFMVAVALGNLLYLLRKKKYLHLCINCSVSLMFFLFLYLFTTGGVAGNAFVWGYTFPLIAFFMLGTKKGFLASTAYVFSCLVVLLLDLTTTVAIDLYTKDFAFRFLSSFVVVILLAFIYELFREKSQKVLVVLNSQLEQKVAERTATLREEVSKKTNAQAMAVQAKEEWERTFNAIPDEIIILDTENRITQANLAMINAGNIPSPDVLGTKCFTYIHGEQKPPIYCPHTSILESRKPCHFEYFDDSRQCYLSVTVSPLYDVHGKYLGSVRVARDITEQKNALQERDNVREQLRKAEKMEAIGLMAGGVAHDLNNILSGVVSYPELLLLQLSEEDAFYKPLQTIHDSGKRAAAVVADLLTVARGVATVREVCSLNELVREFCDSVEYKNIHSLHQQIDVTLELETDLWNINCSPVHIQKILMNLIINAVEAIESNGNVCVSSKNQAISPEDTSTPHRTGEYVVLTIQDTGSGIPEDDLEKIFEPFYTKKVMGRSGTGLGLAVVWNIVKDHGATIHVDSSSTGTIFTLYFPASSEKKAPVESKTDLTGLHGTGSILIVDDEERQREISSQMLEDLGYSTISVSSGESAVTFLLNNSVDLVLLDMLMGAGMNGHHTYKKILQTSPNQKAIIVSGFSASEDVKAALKLGAGSFVKKPYSMEQLGLAVKTCLANQ